jgi:hypothetical protein
MLFEIYLRLIVLALARESRCLFLLVNLIVQNGGKVYG